VIKKQNEMKDLFNTVEPDLHEHWMSAWIVLIIYSWGDSDVILSKVVTASMLEVCYVAIVQRCKPVCVVENLCVEYISRNTWYANNLGMEMFKFLNFYPLCLH